MTKICTRCKVKKEKEEFNKYPKAPDGRMYWCRACQAEKNKKYQRSDSWLKIIIG